MAPTHQLAVIIEDGVKQLVSVRWAWFPVGPSDLSVGSRLINARTETILQKDSFKDAFKKKRCLVVADGFYQWRKTGRPGSPSSSG